ncbi:hypothetical protein [Maritimibacter sp. HL-12]|jgi:hypothetical protein|uniref:hypothetical protein n=1 Tax=Maritimibacter sp. HL-12 TaxID=1162418 RepID=UPI000A0F2AEE|nr:hypothetical protein [Maritimibacter sp. HL-12]SMH57567.1 hypothetical protein SAMN05661107_3447 [Maritimibacter sp. HL-12]
MKVFQTLGLIVALATPAFGQQFTTAAEVKPILDATKSNWIAVREYDGQDLLYFTHLMAWRCGIDQIYYALNGGSERPWDGEPCYEGEAQPNAIKAADVLPFVALPLGSVESVTVRLEYDDGSTDSASYQRADVLTN